MTEIEKAYIAGLFDGEGNVAVHRYKASKNGAFYLRISARITNTDRRPLDWLQSVLGYGCVFEQKRNNMTGRKPAYSFQVMNSKGAEFLQQILPYLKIKGEIVARLLAEPHSGRTDKRRHS